MKYQTICFLLGCLLLLAGCGVFYLGGSFDRKESIQDCVTLAMLLGWGGVCTLWTAASAAHKEYKVDLARKAKDSQ
jgi:hypothetical protein